jgi:hypothetical protein
MMGMPSEVPAHGMDILILLVLANNRLLDNGEDPSGANLIARSETILKDWLDANGDKAGRCQGAPAIPPRTVFIHGINLDESISSEQIVRFLVGFWRLPYAIALYVIHTLDVRLQQLNTHQVLPDEQIILKAFQTAVEKQREQGADVGKRYLEVTGGVIDTTLWTDPLLKPFKPTEDGDAGAGAGLDEMDIHFDNFDFLDRQATLHVDAGAGDGGGAWYDFFGKFGMSTAEEAPAAAATNERRPAREAGNEPGNEHVNVHMRSDTTWQV